MTNREFYSTLISLNIAQELKDFAQAEIDKLNARNDKRKNTPSKTQIENEPLKVEIINALANGPMVASEIASTLNISTQKASALCKILVEENRVSVEDIKVPKKGTLKSYSVVAD